MLIPFWTNATPAFCDVWRSGPWTKPPFPPSPFRQVAYAAAGP